MGRKYNENGFIEVEVRHLIDWDKPNGEGCMVSDRITKDGFKVGYMYREEPMDGYPDSGWRFFAGDEDEEYSNDPANHHIFALNTLCNYDTDVIPFLDAEVGAVFVRVGPGRSFRTTAPSRFLLNGSQVKSKG